MKLGFLAIAVALVPIGFVTPVKAENPAQVRQLLETNVCRGCDLRGAQLSGARLLGADLSGTNLSGANLTNANLVQANLSSADLSNTNLSFANLRNANLSRTNLNNTNLNGANLGGVNLSGTDLNKANLIGIGTTSQPAPAVNNEPAKQPQESPSAQATLSDKSQEPLTQDPMAPPQDAVTSPRATKLSPLERPMTRLFGFETATPLQAKELVLQGGAVSFESPNNSFNVLGNDNDRDIDIRFGVDYGVTDTLQVSLGAIGKDDTIYSNLVGDQTGLQFLYSAIPAQVKWQAYSDQRLSAALVVGTEFPSPISIIPSPNPPLVDEIEAAGINTDSRKIIYTTNPEGLPGSENALLAEDDSVFFSLAVPVSYQLTDRARLHLNPQLSFFPSSISASTIRGDEAALTAAGIGFDGDRLDYYGTVAGIGFGFDYYLSPRVQLAADITPIVSGVNSADSGGDNSLFVAKPVWNVGLRVAANSRLGFNAYATNRFGPNTASPSNLLVQPDGSWGVGLDLIYLPDLTGEYEIPIRDTYPDAQAFLSPLNGFPSATLPISSVLYQLAVGSNLRINPSVRIGLLDDLELALNFSYASNTEELSTEGGVFGRLALLPDNGGPLSATVDAGISRVGASADDLDISSYAFHLDLPVTYRLEDFGLSLTATPKVVIPSRTETLDNIFGVSLGGALNLTENTQFLAQLTPILIGDNQLQETRLPGQGSPFDGKTVLYNFGLRQLFPAGNSLYALDVYFGNSVGDYGFQGISALPDGGIQFGVRFNVLNGVP